MKLSILSALLFLSCTFSGFSQDQINDALLQADSLFKQKKFTQSFEIYEHLLEKERLASPAMLLKMAFIKEGLGDYTNALYYINLYHLQTANKEALQKMEELAQKKGLQGYSVNDFDIIKSIFFRYFNSIIGFLGALSILLVALMFYRKNKQGQKPLVLGVFTVLCLALLFYVANFSRTYNKGIITGRNTYIMDGPSAAAELISIVGKGHRISIHGQKDIWTRIEWEGEYAYIKSDKVKLISLNF